MGNKRKRKEIKGIFTINKKDNIVTSWVGSNRTSGADFAESSYQ